MIGQADARSGDVLADLYAYFDCEKLRVGIEEAELTKYASNALLSLLISFSNELAGLCEATAGTDVETVMEGLYLDRRLSPHLWHLPIPRPGIHRRSSSVGCRTVRDGGAADGPGMRGAHGGDGRRLGRDSDTMRSRGDSDGMRRARGGARTVER